MENSDQQSLSEPSHVIGIGASAGGLEALQEFFSYVPEAMGAAFVVVQHLSPDYKSMMSELLKKHTTMPIFTVEDSMTVEPDTIYLAPPRKNMLITEGKLLLSDQMPDGHPHMSVDVFLRSLAEDQQHRGIGIVLSGTGSDGTRGIRAMKESGGLVVVQKPDSAKFDGMPISAYNTGLGDLILKPAEMGPALKSFISHPSITGDKPVLKYNSSDGDPDTLAEIFHLLKEKSTINFSQYKPSTVSRRIERRLGINQLDNLEDYLKLLSNSPRELQILSKELLIGVTRFFRDDDAFERLKVVIIPNILNSLGKEEVIRVWVAGCSSGEEAYSIAMVFSEALHKRQMTNEIKIYATDVDEEAITEASNGSFAEEIAQDIPSELLGKYFSRVGDRYNVNTSIRQNVIFAVHNMIEDPPFSNLHLVSCRNALIYFQQSAQQRVFSSFYFALQSKGYLFLGSSESLGDMQQYFETIEERNKFFRKIGSTRLPIPQNSIGRRDGSISQPISASLIAGSIRSGRPPVNDKLNTVREKLITFYAPDCIVLNEAFEAVHVYGDVLQYTNRLKHGKVSNNINDMVIEQLSVAVSTALYRCEKNEEDIFYNDVSYDLDGQTHTIDLCIFFVKQSDFQNAPRQYVIQFIEKNLPQSNKASKQITFNANEQSKQRIHDLEQELIKKQEHLQVTVEELETTNEELQSANEELMSANEELQSTNEELQSVNEELYTVNSEYQEKIRQLTEANADLDSVINATDIGIVFLDEHLAIRKFTPHSRNYVNVLSSDIGRPISHISHNLEYDEFLPQIAEVSASGSILEKDVMTKNGQATLLRIMPYALNQGLSQSNQGVLITITNISRLRVVENALSQAQKQFKTLLVDRSERLKNRIVKKSEVSLLVLEDDPIFRKSITRNLKSIQGRKFGVMEADNVASAIDMVKHVKVDVCIVDYTLQGETAEDFAEALHLHGLDLPILLLTLRDEEELDEHFLSHEIIDLLNKETMSTALLERCIDYVIERKAIKDIVEQFQV